MSLFPEIMLGGYALFVTSGVGFMFYKTSARVHSFVDRIFFRKAVIQIEGTSYAVKGDKWKSPVYVNPNSGEIYAWRYPECKIGKVRLRADGTGDYCGEIKWHRL